MNQSTSPAAAPDPMRRLFERVLRELLIATAGITAVGLVAGYLIDAWAGFFGALLGVVAALIFTGTTALSMLYTLHKPPSVLAVVVLGAWIGKMVVLIVMLAVLQDMTFYNKIVFAVVLLIAVLTSMAIDVRAVVRGRVPNVQTGPTSSPEA
jgi:heme O synthase-like polyprenyltransferase